MPKRKRNNQRSPGQRPGPSVVGQRRREMNRMSEDMGMLQRSSGELDPRLLQSLLERLAMLLEDLEDEPPSPKEEEGLAGFFKTIGDVITQLVPAVGPLLALL